MPDQPVRDQAGKSGILITNTEVSDRQERERLQAEQIAPLRELDGADRMLMLVDDPLDFAKLQSGRFEITAEPTPYAALLRAKSQAALMP